jgi:signal transduction histidine kinase
MATKTTILIADDDPNIRHTLGDILQANGYETVCVQRGKDVVHVLDEKFAVALIDLRLSDMSGLDVIKTIKSASPSTECIVLTGYASQETAIEAVNLGAYSYLQKPFDVDQLLVCIMRAVEKRESIETLVLKNRQLKGALAELSKTQDQVVQQERLNALGQMVSGIVHDFNNVLMPIVGLSELLVTEEDELADQDDVRDIVASIRSAAADAREIVRRLREFYRPDDSLDVVPVPVGELADAVLGLTEPAWKTQSEADGRPVEISVDAPDSLSVMANEARLREVLTNLVLNAVDAMPEGGAIRVTGEREGRWGVIRVADSGHGMTEEVRRRCFEPFYSTKGERGTGLGLAVCHGIVERHGGRLEIDTAVGTGTTISVYLPLLSVGFAEERCVRPPVNEVDYPLHHLKVLVIDDDRGPRRILSRFLTRDGHTVVTAASGSEGIERLKHGDFDLVVTDRAMPEMNGDQVASEVKRQWPDLPVILLTGFGDIMHCSGEVPLNVDEVVGKPVTPEEFMASAQRVLRQAARV